MTPPVRTAAPPLRSAARARCGVLVVAAHPDDETIGAAALLARLRAPAILHLTDGAPRDRRFWPPEAPSTASAYAALRRAELSRALGEAGLVRARTFSLEVSDQEAPLHLVAITRAIARFIEALEPSVVVTHPYEGGHPDHDAAAFTVRAAVEMARGREDGPRLFEMTSYHAAGERLETGRFLPAPTVAELCRRLTAEERRRKARMLAAFRSQRVVLDAFRGDLAAERFRVAPPCDFRRPPHDGPLWYELMGFPMTGARWRELVREAQGQLERATPQRAR